MGRHDALPCIATHLLVCSKAPASCYTQLPFSFSHVQDPSPSGKAKSTLVKKSFDSPGGLRSCPGTNFFSHRRRTADLSGPTDRPRQGWLAHRSATISISHKILKPIRIRPPSLQSPPSVRLVEPLGPRIGASRPLHSALTMTDANHNDLAELDFGAGSCLAHPHRMPLPSSKRWGLARRQRSPKDALHGAQVRHAPHHKVHHQLEVSLGVSPSSCRPGGLAGLCSGTPSPMLCSGRWFWCLRCLGQREDRGK